MRRYTEKVSYTDDPVYASDDSVDSTAEVINADTLGGKLPEDYAPAGYGLGERAFNAPGNDANQITKCGFFRAYVNTPTGDWWTIQQEDLYGNGTYMIQKASCFAYVFVLHAERMVVNGKFYEWEWVNPPMVPGVEYRTTERWNGKAVYTKMINCGQLPSVGSTAGVGINASKSITQTIRAEGQLIYGSSGGGDSLPFYNPSYGEIIVNASRYEAKVAVVSWNGTVPSIEAWVRVWYVLD